MFLNGALCVLATC